ncbi:helix-turn-helix transcriptional regulator [Streptomyces flavofungini]|uniref:helix-turn-helix transcriptional regulator n=1 Tax=Streptomyces flavofungini TaxID=68200 RepID=UPI0025B0B4DD|nr:LuxR C-terminal-related transcriptional regulator [Streptomyces flavofungini]WJV50640.1 LuxR C-terminal-related transcriptional regulator [Streptomyces flavofungini]
MPVVVRAQEGRRRPDSRSADPARVATLRGHLRGLGRDAQRAETAVDTCLVWLAGALVRIAEDLEDPHSVGALVDEAFAVLASVSQGGRTGADAGPAPPVEALTQRELMVLRRLQGDVSLRRIADGLFISHNTVKSHARALYRKLGAHSRAEALCRARRLGLI